MKKIVLFLLILPFMMNIKADAQPKSGAPAQVQFVIHTDYGDLKGVLYNETPQHRDNFVKLAKAGFFNGLLFHRVIQGFMIQGGDPDSKNAKPGQALGMGGPGYTVPAEFTSQLIHKKRCPGCCTYRRSFKSQESFLWLPVLCRPGTKAGSAKTRGPISWQIFHSTAGSI